MNLQSARTRKFIGMIGLIAFLVFYIGAVAKLSAYVPDNLVWQTLFYTLFGICWGFPVFPLISWMNRGK